MAVFLLCAFVIGRPGSGLGPYAPAGIFAHITLAEPDGASFLAHHSDNNSVQVTSFDWTNGSHSVTTAPPVSRTKSLIQ
jgi:hypothetical protein